MGKTAVWYSLKLATSTVNISTECWYPQPTGVLLSPFNILPFCPVLMKGDCMAPKTCWEPFPHACYNQLNIKDFGMSSISGGSLASWWTAKYRPRNDFVRILITCENPISSAPLPLPLPLIYHDRDTAVVVNSDERKSCQHFFLVNSWGGTTFPRVVVSVWPPMAASLFP